MIIIKFLDQMVLEQKKRENLSLANYVSESLFQRTIFLNVLGLFFFMLHFLNPTDAIRWSAWLSECSLYMRPFFNQLLKFDDLSASTWTVKYECSFMLYFSKLSLLIWVNNYQTPNLLVFSINHVIVFLQLPF